jgi:hypothetical protein
VLGLGVTMNLLMCDTEDVLQLCTKAEFLDEILAKVLRAFLLAIHSHLNSFVLRFLFLQTHATSYNYNSSVINFFLLFSPEDV